MEETLAKARVEHARVLEEERARCRKDMTELMEQHKINLAQSNCFFFPKVNQIILMTGLCQYTSSKPK